jgi:hypothetical protein
MHFETIGKIQILRFCIVWFYLKIDCDNFGFSAFLKIYNFAANAFASAVSVTNNSSKKQFSLVQN